jgi:WD40 repeat protein
MNIGYIMRFIVNLVCALALLHISGCGAFAGEDQPEKEMRWDGDGHGITILGRSGEYIYGIQRKDFTLELWKWNADSLEKVYVHKKFGDPLSLGIANEKVLTDNYYSDLKEGAIEIRDIHDGKLLNKFPNKYPEDNNLLSEVSRSSMNGKYVAVWKDARTGHPDFKDFKSKFTIGIFDGKENEIKWIDSMQIDDRLMSSRHNVIPSNDGKLLAFASWDNAAGIFDVEKKKMLWTTKPKDDIIKDAAFSPDGKTLYAAGAFGGVYSIDMADGKITNTWYASTTGKQEYGHRISRMSISPDGNYLAAGTGPEGQIFVYSVKGKKVSKILNHGGGVVSLVYFSPDSQRLVTYSGDRYLKIWKIADSETEDDNSKGGVSKPCGSSVGVERGRGRGVSKP